MLHSFLLALGIVLTSIVTSSVDIALQKEFVSLDRNDSKTQNLLSRAKLQGFDLVPDADLCFEDFLFGEDAEYFFLIHEYATSEWCHMRSNILVYSHDNEYLGLYHLSGLARDYNVRLGNLNSSKLYFSLSDQENCVLDFSQYIPESLFPCAEGNFSSV